jgi:hypothetical protein
MTAACEGGGNSGGGEFVLESGTVGTSVPSDNISLPTWQKQPDKASSITSTGPGPGNKFPDCIDEYF